MSYEEFINEFNSLTIRDKDPILTIIKGKYFISNFNGNWLPCYYKETDNNEMIIYNVFFEYKIILDLIIDYLDNENIIEGIYEDINCVGYWNDAVYKAKQEIYQDQKLKVFKNIIDGFFVKIKAVYP